MEVFKGYRSNAPRRGLAWQLTEEEFFTLAACHCYYCGVEPSTVRKSSRNGEFVYNGIDRVDNFMGYVSSNVVPCCSVCNHAKATMSQGDFLAWIDRLVSFRSFKA